MEGQWSEDLSIGIELLDSQHKELFRHISTLRSAMRAGEGRDALVKTLRFLEEYVVVQFNAEESYMRRFNYSGLSVHEEEHKEFVKVLSDCRRKFQELDSREEITSFLSIEIARKLSGWPADHIKNLDKNMSAFLAVKLLAINNPRLPSAMPGRGYGKEFDRRRSQQKRPRKIPGPFRCRIIFKNRTPRRTAC